MRSSLKSFGLFVLTWVATSLLCASATAQTVQTPAPVAPIKPAQTAEPTQPQSPKAQKSVRKPTPRPSRVTMVKDQEPVAPQVVTIVHRLTGVKLLRYLLRNEPGSIATITPQDVNADAHASIIAGVALEDGKTIVARLPQVAAEMEIQRSSLLAPPDEPDESRDAAHRRLPRAPRMQPDLTVMTQDGRTFRARYIGVDGLTGLSVLQLTQAATTGEISGSAHKKVSDGQNVQLFAPERVSTETPYTILVRIGKTEAKIAQAKVKAKTDLEGLQLRGIQLSPNVIGGVACDQAGKTLGIVDAIEGNNARLLTAAAVHAATKRVLERQSSVPRPLLGIRGEEVDESSQKSLMAFGWSEQELEDLIDNEVGILLTSVLPGTPAAFAKLKVGDVILRVNGNDVKGAEEFSEMLTKAGSGEDVKFTVERPKLKQSLSIVVKLGGAFQPVFDWQFEMPKVRWRGGLTLGIEAITLSGKYYAQWGGSGVLVVGVEPESAAARAGLKEGDVIEMINGRLVGRGGWIFTHQFNKKEKQVLSVLRHKEKKQLVIEPVE
ncbi:MAG TPA: PDZ domain-containing protein [Pyrinomonadaceae bacterium]|nr:PDZ domain-containing protein [Pyrinomonadaceae bacterium]